MVGNSSAGIGEAGVYGVPTINIGSRQKNRSKSDYIVHVPEDKTLILEALKRVEGMEVPMFFEFGDGKGAEKFMDVLAHDEVWNVPHQKQFVDIA